MFFTVFQPVFQLRAQIITAKAQAAKKAKADNADDEDTDDTRDEKDNDDSREDDSPDDDVKKDAIHHYTLYNSFSIISAHNFFIKTCLYQSRSLNINTPPPKA